MSPEPQKARTVRVRDQLWNEACGVAEARNETISEAVRDFLRGYVRRNRHLLKQDPDGQDG